MSGQIRISVLSGFAGQAETKVCAQLRVSVCEHRTSVSCSTTMARDRLAAMRAQQASAAGGYTSPGTGAATGYGGAQPQRNSQQGFNTAQQAIDSYYQQEYGNNGYGDHMFPTQQSTGAPYQPPSEMQPEQSQQYAQQQYAQQQYAQQQYAQQQYAQQQYAQQQYAQQQYAQQQYAQQQQQQQKRSSYQAAQQQPAGYVMQQSEETTYVPPTSNPSTAYAPATMTQQPDTYEMTALQGAPGRAYTTDQNANMGMPGGGSTNAGMMGGGVAGTSVPGVAAGSATGLGAGMAGTASAAGYGADGTQNDTYAVNMSSDPETAAFNSNTNTFFGKISEIQDTIRQIDMNVNRISDLHSRSLNNVGEAAQLAAESELTSVAQQTSMFTNFVKTSIKSLEAEATKIPASGPAPEGVGRNVRLTQIGALKNRFKETIMRYQEVEKAYRSKYRQRTERQLRIVKPDATQAEIQSALEGESGGQQIFSQALMNSNRQGEARGALREVQERHSDIQRIERTITELAALFQEMSILVEQQDEQLNVIRDHAQHTEKEVQAGRQQTDKAVVAARRARKRRWICFWILLFVIIIAVAAIVGGVCGNNNCGSSKN